MAYTVEKRIFTGCDHFVDRVQVKYFNKYSYQANGIQFLITFRGYDADPGQFEIVLDDDNTSPVRDNLTSAALTISPYRHSTIFYEPIPFELLRTYETKPQLDITVDGLPAVCRNLDCDFAYVDPVGEITSFTFNPSEGDYGSLTIEGIDLPTSKTDVL